jgi:hypothetical protein
MDGARVENEGDAVPDAVYALMARNVTHGRLESGPIRLLLGSQMQAALDLSDIDRGRGTRFIAGECRRTEQRKRERSRAENSLHCEEFPVSVPNARDEMPLQSAESAGKLRMK